MTKSTRPIPFTQSVASQQVPPPYFFPNVTVNAFVMEVPMGAVQDHCDRFFNLGSEKDRGFIYKPAAFWPYATLMFLEYPVMISSGLPPAEYRPPPLSDHEPKRSDTGDVPYSDRGTVSQTEVFVALPVMRYGTTPGKLIGETALETALPLIAVNDPSSCVCGREMLGLGKLLADISTAEGPFRDSFQGAVKLPGWSSPEPGAQMEMLPFVEVSTGPALPTFRTTGGPQRSLATLFQSREASRIIGSLESIANFIDSASIGLIPTAMRTIGLKQYRDAVNPEAAVYQALVTCRSHYSNVRGFRFYDEKDVSISFNDTGNFNDALRSFMEVDSIATNKAKKVTPKAAFKFMADIDYDHMRVTHRFPIDRGDGLPPTSPSSDLAADWLRPWKGFFGPEHRP